MVADALSASKVHHPAGARVNFDQEMRDQIGDGCSRPTKIKVGTLGFHVNPWKNAQQGTGAQHSLALRGSVTATSTGAEIQSTPRTQRCTLLSHHIHQSSFSSSSSSSILPPHPILLPSTTFHVHTLVSFRPRSLCFNALSQSILLHAASAQIRTTHPYRQLIIASPPLN